MPRSHPSLQDLQAKLVLQPQNRRRVHAGPRHASSALAALQVAAPEGPPPHPAHPHPHTLGVVQQELQLGPLLLILQVLGRRANHLKGVLGPRVLALVGVHHE
jgi:hypothetical protein